MTEALKPPKKLGSTVMRKMTGTAALHGVAMLMNLAFTMVLARLLTPEDFGVVAAAMIVLACAQLFTELGISQAVIQAASLNERELRSAFTIALATAAVSSAACFAGAGLLARLFDSPAVEDVLRVLSPIFLLKALAMIPKCLLLRDLRAQTVMLGELGAKFLGTGVVGVWFAIQGYGPWALVAATLVSEVLEVVWFRANSRAPMLPLMDLAASQRILGVGGGFAASQVFSFIALQGDKAVVGSTMGPAALGFYSRAYTLMSLPTQIYARVAETVVFPALAKIQHDRARVLSAYQRGLKLTSWVGLPMTVFVVLMAEPLVAIVYGSKWQAMVPMFQVLTLSMYLRLAYRIPHSVLRALGHSNLLAVSQAAYAAMVVGGSYVAATWFGDAGPISVAWSVVVAILLNALLVFGITGRVLGAAALATLATQRSGLPGAVVVVAVVALIRQWNAGAMAQVVAAVVILAVLALLAFRWLPPEFQQLLRARGRGAR